MNLQDILALEAEYEIAKNALAKVEYVGYYPSYPPEISDFMGKLHMPPWHDEHYNMAEAARIIENIQDATISQIGCVFVGISRYERFCDGFWIGTLQSNRLAPVFDRLKVLISL